MENVASDIKQRMERFLGQRLSAYSVALTYKVSEAVAQQALQKLADDGLIYLSGKTTCGDPIYGFEKDRK